MYYILIWVVIACICPFFYMSDKHDEDAEDEFVVALVALYYCTCCI